MSPKTVSETSSTERGCWQRCLLGQRNQFGDGAKLIQSIYKDVMRDGFNFIHCNFNFNVGRNIGPVNFHRFSI